MLSSLPRKIIGNSVIDVGELRVSRTTVDKVRGKARYVIYLPINRNYLWQELYEKKAVVRVFLEVVEASDRNEDAKQ